MRKFIRKTGIILLLFFFIAELVSRIIIDPLYFHSLDTYNLKKEPSALRDIYQRANTPHVDYLFIGSSRVPATINPSVFMKEDPRKTAVVAGRGYMTAGIHYQALKNRASEDPGYLQGAKVFIEYPGSGVYTNPFSEDKFRVFEPSEGTNKPMPHLLLPHLDFSSLRALLRESSNSFSVKLNLTLQYCFSSYRTSIFIKEKIGKLNNKYLFETTDQNLVSDGGIRNDNIENARQLVVTDAAMKIERIEKSPELTFADLEQSSLAYLFRLIEENGGTLYLYEVPLTSIQENVHHSTKAAHNKTTFEEWLSSKGIEIIKNEHFLYDDTDFPDAWHLSKDRRDEFSILLYNEFKKVG